MQGRSGFFGLLLTGIILIAGNSTFSQIHINSPYTRFGIGSLNGVSNSSLLSMGGISAGIRSPYTINCWNPASYSAFDTLSFVFDGGLSGSSTELQTESKTSSSSYVSLSHLLFGFPLTSWWKTSIGLVPFSDVGYTFNLVDEPEPVGPVGYEFEGYGGINQFHWGHSFRPFRNFSLGFNMAYLFGAINHNRKAYLPDTAYYFNLKVTETINFHDLYFTFGAQYHKTFRNNLNFTAGLVLNNASDVNARRNYLAESFLAGNNGVEYTKDTVAIIDGVEGNVKFPLKIGSGFTLGKTDQWLVGLDFQWHNWEKYSSFGLTDSLKNSLQISIGGEYLPDNSTLSSYWKSVKYRAGFRYHQTYLEFRENQLNEFGISFGLGLPLKRSKTTINIGIEAGRFGTTTNDLIQENFFRFSIGVSVYERWFVKRRYD